MTEHRTSVAAKNMLSGPDMRANARNFMFLKHPQYALYAISTHSLDIFNFDLRAPRLPSHPPWPPSSRPPKIENISKIKREREKRVSEFRRKNTFFDALVKKYVFLCFEFFCVLHFSAWLDWPPNLRRCRDHNFWSGYSCNLAFSCPQNIQNMCFTPFPCVSNFFSTLFGFVTSTGHRASRILPAVAGGPDASKRGKKIYQNWKIEKRKKNCRTFAQNIGLGCAFDWQYPETPLLFFREKKVEKKAWANFQGPI